MLNTYRDIANGNGEKYLPQGTRLIRIYSRGYEHNPQRAGLKEVRLEGNIPSNTKSFHTRRYHLLHPPYTSDGITLDRVAFTMFAGINPSLIEKVERAYMQKRI